MLHDVSDASVRFNQNGPLQQQIRAFVEEELVWLMEMIAERATEVVDQIPHFLEVVLCLTQTVHHGTRLARTPRPARRL